MFGFHGVPCGSRKNISNPMWGGLRDSHAPWKVWTEETITVIKVAYHNHNSHYSHFSFLGRTSPTFMTIHPKKLNKSQTPLPQPFPTCCGRSPHLSPLRHPTARWAQWCCGARATRLLCVDLVPGPRRHGVRQLRGLTAVVVEVAVLGLVGPLGVLGVGPMRHLYTFAFVFSGMIYIYIYNNIYIII